MMPFIDVRPFFLHEFKLNQCAAGTTRKNNQAFGNENVNERSVRRCFAKFRSGDFSLEDEPRSNSGRVVRTLVETSPSQAVRGMAQKVFSSHPVINGLNLLEWSKNSKTGCPTI